MSKKWYGSIGNRIAENSTMPKPEIGMGVTELCYTDREPYEVIEIINDKKIKIREMIAKRVDTNGMSECQDYKYFKKLDGEVKTLVFRNGKWRDLRKEYENDENGKLVTVETKKLGCNGWLIGNAEKYFDYSF